MTSDHKQPAPPNPFINVGRPAFAEGGNGGKKFWAVVTTIGFGIFWMSALYMLAELFGPRDLTAWPMVLTTAGLVVGVFGRVVMIRQVKEAR